MKDFKINDWCFCEFELQQIKRMEEGRVTEVTTGQFCMSSHDLTDRCFPITMPVKIASDNMQYWHKEFHKLSMAGLNYPDLHRRLVSMWVDICEESNEEILKSLYKKLEEFGRSILNRVRDLKYEEVDGLSLFRR